MVSLLAARELDQLTEVHPGDKSAARELDSCTSTDGELMRRGSGQAAGAPGRGAAHPRVGRHAALALVAAALLLTGYAAVQWRGMATTRDSQASNDRQQRIHHAGISKAVSHGTSECWRAGSSVKIRGGSRYDGQHDTCAIAADDTCKGDGFEKFTFPDGTSNWYEYDDLEPCFGKAASVVPGPVPTAPDGPGKNCPDNDSSMCINGNKGYNTLEEAWKDCGSVPECGAVMAFTNGKFYLRRTSDPSRQDAEIYYYKTVSVTSEATTSKQPTTTTPQEAAPTAAPTVAPTAAPPPAPEATCTSMDGNTYKDNHGATFTIAQEACAISFVYGSSQMTGALQGASLTISGWAPGRVPAETGTVDFTDGGKWILQAPEDTDGTENVVLASRAGAGETEIFLQEPSTASPGDVVEFGAYSETHAVANATASSLVLDGPLHHDYPAGTTGTVTRGASIDDRRSPTTFWIWFAVVMGCAVCIALAVCVYKNIEMSARAIGAGGGAAAAKAPRTRPEMVAAVFKQFDADQDGVLDPGELLAFATQMPQDPFDGTDREWNELLSDLVGERQVDLPFFHELVDQDESAGCFYQSDADLRFLLQMQGAPQPETSRAAQIRSVFHTFDRNLDGILDETELQNFAKHIPYEPFDGSDEDWQMVYDQAVGDQRVDLHHFAALVNDPSEDTLFGLSDESLQIMSQITFQEGHAAISVREEPVFGSAPGNVGPSQQSQSTSRQHLAADLFALLDRNGDSVLDSEELRVMPRHLGMPLNWPQEWRQISGGRSGIQLNEFFELISDASGRMGHWYLSEQLVIQLLDELQVPLRRYFTVVFKRKQGQPVGTSLNPRDPTERDKELQVIQVFDKTLAHFHNENQADPELRIRRQDYIVAVNGVMGNAVEMKNLMRDELELRVEVARNSVFMVGTASERGSCDVCEAAINAGDRIAVAEQDYWVCQKCMQSGRVTATPAKELPNTPRESSKMTVSILKAYSLPDAPSKKRGQGGQAPNVFVEISLPAAKGARSPQWVKVGSAEAKKGSGAKPLPNQTVVVEGSSEPVFHETFEVVNPEWASNEHTLNGAGKIHFSVKSRDGKKDEEIGSCTLCPENLAPGGRAENLVLPLVLPDGSVSQQSAIVVNAEWIPKMER